MRAGRAGHSRLLLTALAVAVLAGSCRRKAIPPRQAAEVEQARQELSAEELLEGGELVFSDDFERDELGDDWRTEHEGWRIEDGELHSTEAKNEGAWLRRKLPDPTEHGVRVEFEARSEEFPDGRFPGDVKCEIFARKPEHEGGYVLINGGWDNSLDVLARLDEHGDDRVEQTAARVKPGQTYQWAIVRRDGTLYWYRDGERVLAHTDPDPLEGRHFGFNNWKTNVYFDDLAVYRLD